ncbi:MAG: DUF3575 domain-containing protein, partial [Bacteroidales bacterium]|nr:DUF3575 domain-containing protein [Bacteroidales bacterium]
MMDYRKFIIAILVASIGVFAPQLKAESTKEVRVPLYFLTDKYEHDRDNISNNSSLDSLSRFLTKIGVGSVRHIDITGYCSPEGGFEYNLKLSGKRADYVRDLLLDRFPDLQGKIETHSGGEAWESFRTRIQKDRFLTRASREKILAIMDQEGISPDTREWRLANKLGVDPIIGQIWPYMERSHFPYLRSCTVVILAEDVVVERVEEQPVEAPVEVEETTVEVPAEVPVEEEAPVEVPAEVSVEAPVEAPVEAEEPAKVEEPVAAPADTVEAKVLKDSVIVETPLQSDTLRRFREVPDNQQVKLHVRESVLGISTNIPYDITWIPGYGLTSVPSFSLEYYPANHGRWTFGLDVEWPMWQHWESHRFMQINNITVWGRRYFKPWDEVYAGPYMFGSANVVRSGIGYDKKGWEGEGAGASVGIGYKHYFGRSRLYFDTGIAVGGFYFQQEGSADFYAFRNMEQLSENP